MQEVRGGTARVFVWPGIHAETGENVRVLAPQARNAFVLTDRNCVEIARRVALSLQQAKYDNIAGAAVPPVKGRPGTSLFHQVDERLGRVGTEATLVVAVGGTPVLHLASHLVSKHGGMMPLFLVPTSVRAQLDSCVSGASCCPIGGRWARPVAVFSDPTVLATLPLREYIAGLADAAKIAVIANGALFEFLQRNEAAIRDRAPAVLEELAYLSATSKAQAVDSSDGQGGALRALEYGHTVGRALERVAGAAILHGEALSVGMEAEMAVSRGLGWAQKDLQAAQNRLLKSFGLPTRVKGIAADRLARDLLGKGNAPRLVLPDVIGHSRGPEAIPPDLIKAAVLSITR